MTTPVKVGLTIGGLAIVYFGFIHKNKNGYTAFQRLMDPTKGGTKVDPHKNVGAEENHNATGKKMDKYNTKIAALKKEGYVL